MTIKEAANRAYNIAEQTSKLIDIDEFIKLRTIEDEATASYAKMRETYKTVIRNLILFFME